MNEEYSLGIYSYKGKIDFSKLPKLPEQLKMDNVSAAAVTLELLMGEVVIKDSSAKVLYKETWDYTKLPRAKSGTHSYLRFSKVLGIEDITVKENKDTCDRFFIRDRRNKYVYEHILNELTQYFVVKAKSPCEGFVHLYRVLEFMSYSFPLIYSSRSKDYRGSYESLKKFLKGGDAAGELKFLGYFLDVLFSDEVSTYEYEFDILFESDNISELRKDFQNAIKLNLYVWENNTMTIKFKNLKDIFVEIRNKYFHMLLGQGSNNFLNMNYDKNDLFRSLNPVFVNWISCIFVKIIQQGLLLYS